MPIRSFTHVLTASVNSVEQPPPPLGDLGPETSGQTTLESSEASARLHHDAQQLVPNENEPARRLAAQMAVDALARQRQRPDLILAGARANLQPPTDLAVDLDDHSCGRFDDPLRVELRPRFEMYRLSMVKLVPENLSDVRRHRREHEDVRLEHESSYLLGLELLQVVEVAHQVGNGGVESQLLNFFGNRRDGLVRVLESLGA